MFAYLWPMTADPMGWPSFKGLLRTQFTDLRYALTLTEWFRSRELWPAILPPDYLATATRPMGLLLVCVGIATFTMPNTYQIFGRFKPALGLPEETLGSGILRRLDWRGALNVARQVPLAGLWPAPLPPVLFYPIFNE